MGTKDVGVGVGVGSTLGEGGRGTSAGVGALDAATGMDEVGGGGGDGVGLSLAERRRAAWAATSRGVRFEMSSGTIWSASEDPAGGIVAAADEDVPSSAAAAVGVADGGGCTSNVFVVELRWMVVLDGTRRTLNPSVSADSDVEGKRSERR